MEAPSPETIFGCYANLSAENGNDELPLRNLAGAIEMKFCISAIAGAVLVGFGVVLLADAAARADNVVPTQAQIDSLIADISAHKQACAHVKPSQALAFKRCSNEQAQLVDRQKRLGISNDMLNGKLKSRGWRWP